MSETNRQWLLRARPVGMVQISVRLERCQLFCRETLAHPEDHLDEPGIVGAKVQAETRLVKPQKSVEVTFWSRI